MGGRGDNFCKKRGLAAVVGSLAFAAGLLSGAALLLPLPVASSWVEYCARSIHFDGLFAQRDGGADEDGGLGSRALGACGP